MSGPPRDPAASSDQLSQRKRELVEKLLRKQAAEAGRNPILRRTDAASAPLSYSQEQLWVLHRMNPLGTAYNVTFALTFKRGVDELLLRGALAELVRRHQILRTVFEPRGDQTVQVVGPESVVTFDAADLPQLSDSERAAELRRLGLTELQRAFDLERGPVGRAVLVRSCEAPAVLFLSFHHIAVDEWSTAILVEELQAIYAALASGVPSPLPELPIQYADYAAWQRHSVRGASFDGQRAYWKQQLAGLPTVRLPIAKERPADPGSTSARDSILLPESLTSGLNELSRRHGVTLFTTLLAGYSALLARYSGQEDIVLGSPVANRQHAETERIIGFFMNMVVLRTATPFRESFRELLRRTHGVVAGAVANQDLPFEEVVSALAPRRRLGENPLFQLTFDLRRDGAPSEVEVTAVVDDADSARFDLEVHAVDHGDAISLNAAYSTDLFDQQGISRLLRHFQTLLESIVADDERPIGLLPILNDAERQALGCTHRVDHAEPCETFVAAFERHVSASATAPAVVSGHDELTYESLDARASGLARWLAARGAARGSIVAVCLDRGPDFVTAVLGVMKAGAAYVPIDPDYPRDRIAFMLHDARASLVLTHERLRELVEPDPADAEPGVAPVEIVCLDRDLARFAGPESVEIHAPDPDDLAYVIYTSGSTGRPKGVLVPHRGLANVVRAQAAMFGVGPGERVLQFSSPSFDASVFDIAMALGSGATLVLANREDLLPGPGLTDLLRRERVTLLTITPSALTPTPAADLPELRTINVAGEACPVQLVARWARGRRFFNLYGPTEATIWTTAVECFAGSAAPTIGRAIPGAAVYIVDGNLQIVPPGIPGELLIGGVGVVRGYCGRPDLTAEQFIPDPFSGAAGSRLYRSGDRARYTASGEIEFLGRIDHQVKVRGYRIELGEIEEALRCHPDVAEAAVIVESIDDDHKRLVAYVVPRADAELPPAEMMRFAKETLPLHLRPGAFVTLAALPLTPNGKLDRAALPLAGAEPQVGEPGTKPRTKVEAALVRIWSDVLRVAHVGIHDNFFELGGDSILTIQIASRATQTGIRLSARDVFRHQTVAELAAVAGTPTAAADDHPASGVVPLTPIQNWFFERRLADSHHFNQAVLLEARRPLDHRTVERALGALVDHHDALRARFTPVPDGWLQEIASPGKTVDVRVVDLAAVAGPDQDRAMEAEAGRLQATLALEGPLFTAALFTFGGRRAEHLLFAVHHLVVDAVSWRILVDDLDLACDQIAEGRSPALPPRSSSVGAWANRLIDLAAGERLASSIDEWLEAARDDPRALPLDFDADRSLNTQGAASRITISLDERETESLLRKLPTAFGTQINDVLLSAVAIALARWSGPKVRLALEGHGRVALFEDVDVSRTVGWFTTLLPVSLDLHDPDDAVGVVKHVKQRLHDAPRRGVEYGAARYLSNDALVRSALERASKAEVGFNYLGQYDQAFSESRCWRPSPVPPGASCSPSGERPYLVDVSALIVGGRLQVSWAYCPHLHRAETIERLGSWFADALRALIRLSAVRGTQAVTPSDFPCVTIDQSTIDRLTSQYSGIEDVFPLWPLQQGLHYHAVAAPDEGVYIQQLTSTITGDLNPDALRDAWQQVADRHAPLRTAFPWQDLPEPRQVVLRSVQIPWTVEDWSDVGPEEESRRFEAFLVADRSQGFDLAVPPAMRLTLLRLGPRTWRVIWTFHHILLDGWSLRIVMREVTAAYRALVNGRRADLPPPPAYREYVSWLGAQGTSAAEPFWKDTFHGFSGPTRLNLPRPLDPAGLYGERWSEMSEETTDRLKAVARAQQLTLNTFVQGAWALLLARYTGQRDVVFGTSVAGRPGGVANVDAMIGLFINTLPTRIVVNGAAGMLAWLREIQERQVEMREYEHVPLAQVQRWIDPASGDALFETLLAFENFPIERGIEEDGSDLQTRDVRVLEQTHYPITIVAAPGRRLLFRLSYDGRLFDADTIGRMLGHLTTILEELAADPARPVGAIALLGASAQAERLAAGVGLPAPYPEPSTIGALFANQARTRPKAVAVESGDRRLDYAGLDARANQLAHVLQRRGIGPDVVVGICLEGGLDLIVAVLGVIKAGGAYLALEPGYPAARLAWMLRETRAPLVLTTRSLRDRIPSDGVEVLCLDEMAPAIDASPATPPAAQVGPDHLAYVSYTSGSTGEPKGVAVPHRGVVRLLFGVDYARFGPEETWLQLAPVAFDASTLEIWGALLHGGRLVVASDRMPTPESLAALVKSAGITSMWLTSSLYNAVVDAEPGALAGIRQLLIGGEALSVGHVRRGLVALSSTTIINGYGPTEGTTFTCCYPIPRSMPDAVRSIPIGRPLSNTSVYVLDAAGHPAPVGVPGELFIGGDGLARGYANQPALTADRFVPDPCGEVPGGRLYRTGDLVRWTSAGMIEFVGRTDEQVKIRGFRVEPGEIETALGLHASVQAAAVIVREDIPGLKRLVAYVVPGDAGIVSEEILRAHLRARLPEYMIPAVIVPIDALPRTSNGKLDRRALPVPELSSVGIAAPRTNAEETIAAIWADVLGIERVGVDANFFELGGDSILNIQICARAQRAGFDVTPKQLFEHPTVAALARVARPRAAASRADEVVTGPVRLLPAQWWLFEQRLSDPHHFNQAVLLEVQRPSTCAVLESAIHTLLVQHDALRARFVRTATGWEQSIDPPPEAAVGFLSRVDLRHLDGEAQQTAQDRSAAAVQASLDLQHGPAMRAALFERGRGQAARLLLVVHHLVVDSVSWRVLLDDLETVCRQLESGEPVSLPGKSTSVRQWADRLADFAASPAATAAAAWWRNAVSGPVPRLPIDFPQGAASNTTGAIARVTVTLTAAETTSLLQQASRAYRTQINDVLLTAVAQAVAEWTASATLFVNLEGHGRDAPFDAADLSRTVGWLTSICPVRLTLPASDQPGAALVAVKEQLRSLPSGGGLTYGALRYLSTDTTLRATLATAPAPEIGFNYLGQFDQLPSEGRRFALSSESTGPTASPRQKRAHLIDVAGFVSGGQLRMDWVYCPHAHTRATIDALALRWHQALRALIAHCAAVGDGGYTPSDFQLARIEQRTIDALSDRYRVQGIEDVYPASPLQQGMVFHSMATPGSSLFVTQLDCLFEGDLDSRAMAGAWEALVARHPVLRTVFVVGGIEDIHQVVVRNARLPWIEEDWRSVPAAEQPKRLADWLREDRRRGFDVARPPLLRVTLFKMADDRHHLVATHHHGLLDGWSFPLVFQELLADYRARRSGSTVEMSPRRPYRDYIEWLERRDRAAEERYWREALAGFDEPTVLAVDAAPGLPPGDEETSDEQIVSLPAPATRAIEAYAQRQRLTLNTVVQGAWALLLARYSGRDDVVFGTTVSGRPADLPGVEQMIGLFINGLPTRVRIDANLRIGEWLQRLQAQHAGMRQHEGSSVVEIQGWSDVPRGARLFDTTYVFENYPEEEGLGAKLTDIGLRRAEVVSNTSSGLHLRVIPGARLALRLVYDRRRFASDDVQRILGQLTGVVEQFAAGSDSTIGSVSIATTVEAEQLPNPAAPIAAVWSGAAHEQFARTAQTGGDRIAIVDQDGSRSYRWLNERSSQLAQHLVRSGINREDVVAVYADRSAALVLAVLGVAKSGGAFMLLDPAYPASRHLECLRATNARAFIQATDGPLPDELLEYLETASLRCRVALPDDQLLDRHSSAAPPIAFAADDLAYVAFTSGSEGQPKGVLGRHGPLAQYAAWLEKTCGFGPDDRAAMLSAIPHDPLLRDIFPTLQLGATLCIPGPALMATPGRLLDWMQSAGVTSCNLTPALARLICEDNGTVLPRLRNVLIVGEVLSPRDVAALRNAAPSATCVNLYGSTEAQQALAYFILPAAATVGAEARIPIGRGIDGVQLLVLNQALRPAGIGEVGEIWVRTPHLSRGYLNDDALTRSRFVINPLTSAKDDRMYRTGDLGRYLPNGEVCFVGRCDRQVKIRGYRVEPGEVEAVILQHDGVREVAVAAHGDDRDARVLVAYVVGTPSPSDMREFLKRRLPSALVPAHIVEMDRLPRTGSGKIDRRSLPAPEHAGTMKGYVAPWSPIEQTLASFWADVLGAEQIGLHDNFFDRGGHSLLAAKLVARVRQEFQVELPINAVFENPVLGELALVLTRALLNEDAELAQLLDEVKELPDDRAQALIDDETSGSDAGVPVTS